MPRDLVGKKGVCFVFVCSGWLVGWDFTRSLHSTSQRRPPAPRTRVGGRLRMEQEWSQSVSHQQYTNQGRVAQLVERSLSILDCVFHHHSTMRKVSGFDPQPVQWSMLLIFFHGVERFFFYFLWVVCVCIVGVETKLVRR